jgi:hypothetical protein
LVCIVAAHGRPDAIDEPGGTPVLAFTLDVVAGSLSGGLALLVPRLVAIVRS